MERRNPRRHCVLEHARTRCVFHWRGVEFLRNETWRASSPIMLLPRSARGTSRPVNGRPDEASKQPRLSSRQVSNLIQATGHAPGSSLCTFGQVGEQPGGQSQSSGQAGKQAGKQASRRADGQLHARRSVHGCEQCCGYLLSQRNGVPSLWWLSRLVIRMSRLTTIGWQNLASVWQGFDLEGRIWVAGAGFECRD